MHLIGMNVQPGFQDEDAFALLGAHCRNLDPEAPTARERLEETLGEELTAKLLFALGSGHEREPFAA
jgi:hypothetical protein